MVAMTKSDCIAVAWIEKRCQNNRKHDSEVPFSMHFYVGLNYIVLLTVNTRCVHTRNEN